MTASIILASNSPRRKELLRQIGIDFTSDVADVDESILPGEKADAYAVRVAYDKAKAVQARAKSGIIIAADTVVVLDEMILGKPSDIYDAGRMLSLLSGKMHRVITGLVVMDVETSKTLFDKEETQVWFRALTPEQIAAYVNTGEPLDKAGAYGIQGIGALFVEKIQGCYFNVVGLPLVLLDKLLGNFRMSLL